MHHEKPQLGDSFCRRRMLFAMIFILTMVSTTVGGNDNWVITCTGKALPQMRKIKWNHTAREVEQGKLYIVTAMKCQKTAVADGTLNWPFARRRRRAAAVQSQTWVLVSWQCWLTQSSRDQKAASCGTETNGAGKSMSSSHHARTYCYTANDRHRHLSLVLYKQQWTWTVFKLQS